MMPIGKNQLSAAQLQALPISIGEARKILGPEAHGLSDDELARHLLYLNDLAIFLSNNISLHKMHV